MAPASRRQPATACCVWPPSQRLLRGKKAPTRADGPFALLSGKPLEIGSLSVARIWQPFVSWFKISSFQSQGKEMQWCSRIVYQVFVWISYGNSEIMWGPTIFQEAHHCFRIEKQSFFDLDFERTRNYHQVFAPMLRLTT